MLSIFRLNIRSDKALSFGNIRCWNSCITSHHLLNPTYLYEQWHLKKSARLWYLFRCILNTQCLLQAVPASQRSSWGSFLKAYDVLPRPLERSNLFVLASLPFQEIFLHSLRRRSYCLLRLSPSFQVSIWRFWPNPTICLTSLNFVAYWCERPDLFAAIADAKPGYERSMAVLRWFIVRLHLLLSSSLFSWLVLEHSERPVYF